MMANVLLSLRDVSRRFGGLIAVSGVSADICSGEIFGIIGPNGAGKTTLFNVVAGYFAPSSGKVLFDGADISGQSSDRVARLGIGRTFQAVTVFQEHTVRENLRRAAMVSRRYNPLVYFASRDACDESDVLQQTARFTGLEHVLDSRAASLSYGQQKMLGIGMALMGRPRLLLMDEPAAGLHTSEKKEAAQLIRRLRDELGITLVLVEHDMPLVMGVCDRILVINRGMPLALGNPDQIKADRAVIDAYLGDEYDFA